MMSHIGVLGGMFDPIHNGHIEAPKFASENLSLEPDKTDSLLLSKSPTGKPFRVRIIALQCWN
ncbi:MAG: hypothetical protein CM1200mP40_07980 [Gammaproteobacteria bacterium]|nr:MAG: hypothetical protein CM1200mP40_07980 [Gammaproteobacteria bacterium]